MLPKIDLEKLRVFFFNAWSLFLLWVIGGVYIPKEYFGPKISRILKRNIDEQKCTFSLNKSAGKVVVITGGSRGIGIVVVRKLLTAGMHVIIGSSASETQRSELENDLKLKIPSSKVEVWSLNLSSMASVKDFALKFDQKGIALHLLINNAGIMFVPYEETLDKLESHFAVNYLGHCLLTKLLLPKLEMSGRKEGKNARIVNLTSCVALISNIHFNDLQGKKRYSPYHAYMQSKLAQLMFSYALNRYLESKDYKVNVFCVHPGVVDTALHQNVWWAPKTINRLYRTPEEGSRTILSAGFSDSLNGEGGKYLENCAISKSSNYSLNVQIQNRLWQETRLLLKNWTSDWK